MVMALEAEGLSGLMNGYANIHLLPMYQKKIAYGKQGFPWKSEICKREVNYNKDPFNRDWELFKLLKDKNKKGLSHCGRPFLCR